MATAIQRLRALQVIRAIGHYGHENGWEWKRTRRAMRMALMCGATEANWLVYANRYNTESLALEHDAVGWDHDSVGFFQQRTPMWGDTKSCMNPDTSARKFINAMNDRGLTLYDIPGVSLAERIQRVQVSAPGQYDSDHDGYGDGANYALQFHRAGRFLFFHILTAKKAWTGDPLKKIPTYPNPGK